MWALNTNIDILNTLVNLDFVHRTCHLINILGYSYDWKNSILNSYIDLKYSFSQLLFEIGKWWKDSICFLRSPFFEHARIPSELVINNCCYWNDIYFYYFATDIICKFLIPWVLLHIYFRYLVRTFQNTFWPSNCVRARQDEVHPLKGEELSYATWSSSSSAASVILQTYRELGESNTLRM